MSSVTRCDAVIFDMDGLMIDSEPYWQSAQREIFAKVGIKLSHADVLSTTGIRTFDIVKMRYKEQPWDEIKLNITQRQLADMIVDKVIELILDKGQPLKGLKYALNYFYNIQGIKKLAVASSADLCVIKAVMKRLSSDDVGIKDCEKFIVKCSAGDLDYGKPHPAVYLEAARQLGVEPRNCLALEDSLNGTLSAKSAQMRVISVPVDYPNHNPRFIIANKVIQSLDKIDDKLFNDIWPSNQRSKL